jgi:hypothetical protein
MGPGKVMALLRAMYTTGYTYMLLATMRSLQSETVSTRGFF